MLRLVLLAFAVQFAAAPQVLRDLRTFDRVLLLETKAETSAGVSVGDVDGDGKLDLVLAKGRHWPLYNVVMRGDGKGHFTASNVGDAPDRTYSAALADLDGDGDLDLVVSNDRPDRKLIYKNDGKGNFAVSGTFGEPAWSTRYVTVADLNHDGRPDLIAANRGGSGGAGKWTPSYVCLNDGNGGFPSCNPLATESATIIVAADLDGDGLVDLFVPHRDGGQNLVFWNEGRGMFGGGAPTAVGPAHSAIRAAAAGDIDGDGKPDLIYGDEQKGLFVALNNGRRGFAEPVHIGGGSPYAIAIADMDRNGSLDIVVGNAEGPGAVYFNQSKGSKGLLFQPVTWSDGKGSVYGVAIADLDGDGWPDIAAARSDAPNGVWFSEGIIQRPGMPGRRKGPKPVDK